VRRRARQCEKRKWTGNMRRRGLDSIGGGKGQEREEESAKQCTRRRRTGLRGGEG